ncbi:MAG: hypothetical protein LBR43_02095 [Spiroplasmataceae bacterium]|nr:hypothetical protein [Spiroplasmataceae bacterium]
MYNETNNWINEINQKKTNFCCQVISTPENGGFVSDERENNWTNIKKEINKK